MQTLYQLRFRRASGLLLTLLFALLLAAPLYSQRSLLYLEAQAVGSYSFEEEQLYPYSHHAHDAMQKPALGFDYLMRFGSASRDLGYLSLQTRLAYDEYYDSKLKLQIYNAFINLKTRSFDIWLGHNKPALGLSSELDNHASLLADNTMSALNYDRDWGLGIKIDRGNPGLTASLTTGSGMPLHLEDTYLLSSRIGWGNYERNNLSLGVSAAYGQVLRNMGYVNMHNFAKHKLMVIGLDARARAGNLELQGDLLTGEYHDQSAYSALVRLGYHFLPEERASLELQALAQELTGAKTVSYSLATGLRLTPDLSLRASYSYQEPSNLNTIALQLYYIKGLTF